MTFTKLLIANRGEIAVRIERSARALGYRTVAVWSDADRREPHVDACDEALRISGPAPYLAIERIVEAARRSGADAVHPGYGFLAENADFARACTDAGLVFIGPDPEVIELMGDKARAKARMRDAGVPIIPGYDGDDPSVPAFERAAAELAYPVLVKAVAGGGGRGMRRVDSPDALAEALERARSEAESAFGDGRLMLERWLTGTRHVEVQIFGDLDGQVIHLGERDCSVQRRHQKVIEESPSPAVDTDLRERLGDAAVAAAQALGYQGAGTVEFLLAGDGAFYFMEMNTRLQVEHPVTELITGLDLVGWQLRVAAGEPLPLMQDEIKTQGHAIEARLYAEDPAAGFLPSPGRLLAWRPGVVEGVRVDHALRPGSEISALYDPMIAKLIAHGASREEARRRLVLALEDTLVFGPMTNRHFLVQVLEHETFVAGRATTSFLEDEAVLAPGAFAPPVSSSHVTALAALLVSRPALLDGPADTAPWSSAGATGWPVELERDDDHVVARIMPEEDGYRVAVDGEDAVLLEILGFEEGRICFEVDGWQRRVGYCRDGRILVLDDGGVGRRFAPRLDRLEAAASSGDGRLRAPMSGRIVAVHVAVGEECELGQTLLALEAMKLETPLKAPFAGRVEEVRIAVDEQVSQGQELVVIQPNAI